MKENVIEEISNQPGSLMFYCPGCDMEHVIYVNSSNRVNWFWNNDLVNPTFSPSYDCRYPWGEEKKMVVCHSFIKDGEIQYLSDCTHKYSGQTVKLPPVSDWL